MNRFQYNDTSSTSFFSNYSGNYYADTPPVTPVRIKLKKSLKIKLEEKEKEKEPLFFDPKDLVL
ncbi:MAG: hypothetical protein ACTSWJ_10985 [Candidatus Heimdallarchaeaceae archaeon]